jgi:uncharacterized protein YndB with AHSA1/START domain
MPDGGKRRSKKMSERSATDVTPVNGLLIERDFDAPRALVFRAWTMPEHFARWYGPDGFTVPHCTLDVRVDGRLHFCMRSEQMGDMWNAGVYQVIDPPSRLVFSLYFSNETGDKVPNSTYGVPEDFPPETLVSLTFEDLDAGKTRMTMHHDIPTMMAGHAAGGWNQAFDKLAIYLTTGG